MLLRFKMSFIKYLTIVIVFSISVYCILMHYDLIGNYITYEQDVVIKVNRSTVFDSYLKKFNKSYSSEEYQTRLRYFRDSTRKIYRLNRETGARHGWTKFTDMSKAELSEFLSIQRNLLECKSGEEFCTQGQNSTIFPDRVDDVVDWRRKGVVSPVVNQLRCAACWAISIVETMEAMSGIRELGTERLSIQELLDCSEHNSHCSGGSMLAMEWLCSTQTPITTEDNYPLTLQNGSCDNSRIHGGRRLNKYSIHCPMNEYDMLRVLSNHGPIVVVINAEPLISYTGGIIQRNCIRSKDGYNLLHMVQIVGYNRTAEVPYYIVKNSWGEEYGHDGYVYLAVNKNICGVADEVAFLDVY